MPYPLSLLITYIRQRRRRKKKNQSQIQLPNVEGRHFVHVLSNFSCGSACPELVLTHFHPLRSPSTHETWPRLACSWRSCLRLARCFDCLTYSSIDFFHKFKFTREFYMCRVCPHTYFIKGSLLKYLNGGDISRSAKSTPNLAALVHNAMPRCLCHSLLHFNEM